MEDSISKSAERKVWWRHWSIVFILAVLAGLIIWVMLNLGPWLRSWQDERAAKSAQEQLEKLYREDKYGGKTPEETFDMFIAALEQGDIELASKYFVLEKQDDWFKTLSQYQARDLLAYLISELKNNKEDWKKNYNGNSVEFYYKVVIEEDSYANFKGQKVPIEAGEYSNTVRFEKYPSGVWKISLL